MQKINQDMAIGPNIVRLRKERKRTQMQLEIKMQTYGSKISDTTLAKIEGGYRNIKVSDLLIMKVIFNISFDDFFFGLNVSEVGGQ